MSDFYCSSGASENLSALCVKIRLHDVVYNLSNNLKEELYKGQVTISGGKDVEWIMDNISGACNTTTATLSLLHHYSPYQMCSAAGHGDNCTVTC